MEFYIKDSIIYSDKIDSILSEVFLNIIVIAETLVIKDRFLYIEISLYFKYTNY